MSDILQDNDPYNQPSFSLNNRLRRAAWNVCCAVLFRPTLRSMDNWRSMLLRAFGAKIGYHCSIKASVKVWAPWNLIVEDYAALAEDVNVYSMALITVGERAIVSQGANLCAGTHDYESKNFQLYSMPITIGPGAWLCTECFVGPGVTIGEGAVVGARAVVTKDVPEWMVCAGNPCKPIKPRVIRDA